MEHLPFTIIFLSCIFIGNVSCVFSAFIRQGDKVSYSKHIPKRITEVLNRVTEKQDLMELCKNQTDTCKEYVCKMRKHEVFDPCMGNCEKSCLTQYALKCDPECVPSCICEAGYVREGGQCIPVIQCVDRIFDYRVYKDKEIVTFPPNTRIYPYFPKLKFTFKTEKHDSNKAVATTKRRFKTATFESLLNAAWKKHQQIEKLKYYSS